MTSWSIPRSPARRQAGTTDQPTPDVNQAIKQMLARSLPMILPTEGSLQFQGVAT